MVLAASFISPFKNHVCRDQLFLFNKSHLKKQKQNKKNATLAF